MSDKLRDAVHALVCWESGLKDILAGMATCKSKLMELQKEPRLTERELATMLHALRILQAGGRIEGCAAGLCEHFVGFDELTNDEIDALCEKLNIDVATETKKKRA